MQFDYSPQLQEIWMIYLRKSRQDDPTQTVEEVLAKHETMLQEHAERELGRRIPEENIYREVVSGESIDEREEIKKVLARIEEPNVAGVLVIEPQRLSRGDLEDCGRLINALRFTHTQVGTPTMTYNLENKMERKFFQDELLRGRDYLEYTKEILFRGRIAAAKRGCYISSTPPFGYNRIKIGRDWTLEANDDADLVRTMFDWYVKEGLTPGKIAKRLTSMGYKASGGGAWNTYSVRDILKNIHYIGKIRYNNVKATWIIENGERVLKHLKSPDDEVIISEGKHDGIVDKEIFEAAQNRFSGNPRIKQGHELINMFSGVLKCKKCGRVMCYLKKIEGVPRYVCRCRPSCYKSAKASEVEQGIIVALEQAELPKLRAKLKNGDGNAAVIQKKRLEKLAKQMAEYRVQEDKQYELLETGKYTQELFDRRNAALRAKIEDCEKEMHQAKASMPKNVDYGEAVAKLEEAIAALKDPEASVNEKNRLLRAIIDRIEYSSTDLGLNKTDIHLEVFLRL